MVQWLQRMHGNGATLCSACSGLLLLAETDLLSGREATMHWAYEQTFRRNFPDVQLRLEEMLVTAGERQELVMSGAAMAWHDLVLYLIDRYVGTASAQSIARFFAMRWHDDGQSPYIGFAPSTGHGDAAVADAQAWLDRNFPVANPVDEMVKRSGIPERSFKRRFTQATGIAPLDYVQRLRIEYAKRRLEQSDTPIDEISWARRLRGSRLLPQAVPTRHRGRTRRLPAQVPRAGPRRPRRSLSQKKSCSAAFGGLRGSMSPHRVRRVTEQEWPVPLGCSVRAVRSWRLLDPTPQQPVLAGRRPLLISAILLFML